MSTKYKFLDPEGIYFVSITVVFWLDVFTRREYKDILINSLSFCTQKKGLIIYGYVIMSNHMHLIIGKSPGELSFSDILRDFKKYTAMHLVKSIGENPEESRRKWLLDKMKWAGATNSNNVQFQFWQQDNHPILLEGRWLDEKLNYIHLNPVVEGWVNEPWEYFYSSARNYAELECPIKITSIYDGIEI